MSSSMGRVPRCGAKAQRHVEGKGWGGGGQSGGGEWSKNDNSYINPIGYKVATPSVFPDWGGEPPPGFWGKLR
jgi:hypothetical protein